MTRPRYLLINDQHEGFYHCVSRCVRGAFLHGKDKLTGKCYEHRKVWLHKRLMFLAEHFLIDVGSYALMDNHLHVLLRNRPDLSQFASEEEVAQRWLSLSPKQRNAAGEPQPPSKEAIKNLVADRKHLAEIRQRLSSISWFMKYLKEPIARMANHEDGCRGRFWEGRFKSTALLDDAAVLTCMVYIDLNPIRAKLAKTPETSKFTSAEERIRGYRARQAKHLNRPSVEIKIPGQQPDEATVDQWLSPMGRNANRKDILSIDLPHYLEILDWTGRQLVAEKPGVIPEHFPPILTRLAIDPNHWLESAGRFGKLFSAVAGTETHMREAAIKMDQKWVRGLNAGKTAFLS